MPLETIEDNLKALVKVQDADTAADSLAKTRQEALDTIDLNEARMKAFLKQAEEEKKTLVDLQKTQKTLEIEVASLETKIGKYQNQLFEVKSNKDYDALKGEIESAKSEKARVEDKILDGLFRQDEQKKKIETLSKQVEDDRKRLAGEKASLEAKAAQCGKDIEAKHEESRKLLAEVDAEWADAYLRLRDSGKRTAVAEITEDRMCSGCSMSVPAQTIIEVRRASQIIRCSCGRLLYVKD